VLDDETPETVQTDDSSATQDEVDWQKRFTDTQAEYTRSQQALKDAQSVWEDEQALISRIGEKFPHLIADDETDDEDDFADDSSPDPDVMTKAEFKAWQDEQAQAQQAKDAVQQFNDDLTRFVGDDRELDQYGEAWIKSQTFKGPEELEAAVNGWFEHLDSLGSKPRKKRPTTSPAGGKTVTGVPNYGDMTREQANDAMVDRARALESQT
jgi:hypothetical protein